MTPVPPTSAASAAASAMSAASAGRPAYALSPAPGPLAYGALSESLCAPPIASFGPARLLAGLGEVPRLGYVAHVAVHGPLPAPRPDALLELAELTGLRGRGGGAFPFARKLRAVQRAARRQGTGTAVVVNGSESEPVSLKDRTLLLRAPHLVLDGALLAAEALGAGEVCVGVTRQDTEESVRAALAEREAAGPLTRVVRLPDRFVTGESSALVNGLGQAPALPSGRGVRVSENGLGGLPTLLSNTETFAQLAVAARLGARAYRDTGLPGEPGTVLLTLTGRGVLETPTGVPLGYLLRLCGIPLGQGVLVGGYHGSWLTPEAVRSACVSRASLEALGATLGAGAVLPLREDTCPVGETARVARWLAGESAGQCGPCVLGLPALADALTSLAEGGTGGSGALEAVRERAYGVSGRGACTHPDGVSRFVASAMAAFADDFALHARTGASARGRGRGCGRPVLGALPVPEEATGRPVAAPPPAAPGPVPGAPVTLVAARPRAARLIVNWTLCRGHGLCAGIVPDLVELGPDGYPTRAAARVPAHLRRQARRAVRRCPALALRLES
ncbi:NADH-quinone oxidoreductase subunit NuoF family protein [Streptomyces albiaxialis]|uniref:NADH-quinone oxidoreductase subunit NuoF family protein n=1 Tax=Streptomyces albiaxialis TaxID=329523 RepID=A0ABP5IMJ7_9ACTN